MVDLKLCCPLNPTRSRLRIIVPGDRGENLAGFHHRGIEDDRREGKRQGSLRAASRVAENGLWWPHAERCLTLLIFEVPLLWHS